MPFFSSISSALERIHLPTSTNFDFNSSISYLDPILQGSNISAATIATVAAVLAASYHVAYNVLEIDKPKGYRNIPKVSGLRTIYHMTFDEIHPFERYERIMRQPMERDGIIRMNLLGRHIVQLGSPEYARQLLLDTQTFQKLIPREKFPNSFISRFFGDNIVLSNNKEWKHHRKVCNPAFHKSWSTDIFGECVDPMLQLIISESKNGKNSVDMPDLLKKLTLDALGKAIFDYNFDAVKNPNGEYIIAYNNIIKNGFNPVYFILPWLDNIPFLRRTKLYQSVDEFNGFIFKMIDEKRQKLREAKAKGAVTEDKDLLTLMIEANESDEDPLTNEQLRSNVITFFVAGHDTTAGTLNCALYHIARRPDLQEQLHAEIFNIVGPATTNSTPVPTADQTKDMKLLDAVIKEVMRLHPSAPVLQPRQVSSNTQIGPYVIPPGVDIQVNVYSIHHNPKYWDNPEEFRPERFLPDADGNMEKRDPIAWAPFSYGSRSCIGTNFSLIEQRVILSMMIHRFTFALPADSPHKDTPKFPPRGSISVKKLQLEFTPRY